MTPLLFLPLCQVGNSDELGRYLYATRDLKPGELILMETPLVYASIAPRQSNCIGCAKPIEGQYRCGTSTTP